MKDASLHLAIDALRKADACLGKTTIRRLFSELCDLSECMRNHQASLPDSAFNAIAARHDEIEAEIMLAKIEPAKTCLAQIVAALSPSAKEATP